MPQAGRRSPIRQLPHFGVDSAATVHAEGKTVKFHDSEVSFFYAKFSHSISFEYVVLTI